MSYGNNKMISLDEFKQQVNFYHARLAGVELLWEFSYPDTADYLKKWIIDETVEAYPKSSNIEEGYILHEKIKVSDQEFRDWKSFGNTLDEFAEFCLLCQPTSQYLLKKNRCVFHAVALCRGGKAWLIAGNSGVGKSTRCRLLLDRWPDEFSVINGDKPILEYREDQTIMVHPSPWNGKEGWHGAGQSPLSGIIFLRRGEKTDIRELPPASSVPLVYRGIFHSWNTAESLKSAAPMTEYIINNSRIWLLTSDNIEESVDILYKTLFRQ